MMQAFVFTSTTRKGRTTDKVVITAHASFCLASAKPWRSLHVCRLSDRPEQSGLTTQKLVVMSASALYPLAVRSDHDEFAKVTKTKIQPKKEASNSESVLKRSILVHLS